jgi:exonuclease SbcD
MGHAYLAAGQLSELSERRVLGGNQHALPADIFAAADYTALGHLHRPQNVGGRSNLRYSGTPLAYSFSENHEKSITLLEMAPDGTLTSIDEVKVPVGRPVHTVTGRMDTLLAATPTAKQRASFVRAVITDSGVVLDAKQRLAALYPHVVEIEMKPQAEDGTALVANGAPTNRGQLKPEELADMFWQDSTKRPPTEAEEHLLHTALEAATRNAAGKEA